jgi:hypothetical protein
MRVRSNSFPSPSVRNAPLCRLVLLALGLTAAASRQATATITIQGYEPRLHDRFYVGEDRAFIGEGQPWSRFGDWSGVGAYPDPHPQPGIPDYMGFWAMTMISDTYFITAGHVRPTLFGDDPNVPPKMRFYRDDDPNGEFWEGTVVRGPQSAEDPDGFDHTKIGNTDIYIGHLNETPPDWVKRYPLIKRNIDTNWIEYIDPTIFLFGQGDQPHGYHTSRVGRNEVEHRFAGNTIYNATSPPGLGADEARTEPYDSAQPMFAISPAGPALFTVAIGLGDQGNPTMPEHYQAILDVIPDTETVRLVTDLLGDLDADYDVDGDDVAIMQPNLGAAADPFDGYFLGDLDRNGMIDAADEAIMNGQLGKLLRPPADFTLNHTVDGDDFASIANHWQTAVTPSRDGDVTGNGFVDYDDILAFEKFRISPLMGQPTLQIAGDANLDGAVTVADIQLWVANFERVDVPEPFYTDGDVTGDALVDGNDLAVILDNYGKLFADANGDLSVNLSDVDVIVGNWGETVAGGRADGDLNMDTIVDAEDLAGVGEFLGFRYRFPLPSQNIGVVPGDFTGDFKVDGTDFLLMQRQGKMEQSLAGWSKFYNAIGSAPPPGISAVPEPATWVLAAGVLGALNAWRRRRAR